MDFDRFNEALAFAARAHRGQFRKGSPIPYISHPVAVAAIVADQGGDLDSQIAALLHDVLEDAGPAWAAEITTAFGPRVFALVESCTDGLPDANGEKSPWRERKEAFLAGLARAGDDALLVVAADKLANLRSLRQDLEETGPTVFARFKGGRDGTLWYYQELLKIFDRRSSPLATAIARELAAIGYLLGEE